MTSAARRNRQIQEENAYEARGQLQIASSSGELTPPAKRISSRYSSRYRTSTSSKEELEMSDQLTRPAARKAMMRAGEFAQLLSSSIYWVLVAFAAKNHKEKK